MSRRQRVPSNLFYRKADPNPPLFPEPNEGDIYFNTIREVLRIFHDGAWMDYGGGGSGGDDVDIDEVIIDVDPPTGNEWDLWVDPDAPAMGSTTILSGTATPTDSDGEDGNYYLDTDDHILYGPKDSSSATVWPIALSSGMDQTTADGRYVNVSGDTMTGPLIQAADPVNPLGTATKQYVDSKKIAFGTWIYDGKVSSGTVRPNYGHINYFDWTVSSGVSKYKAQFLVSSRDMNGVDRTLELSNIYRGDVVVVLRNNNADDGTTFRFPTVGPASRQSYGTSTECWVVDTFLNPANLPTVPVAGDKLTLQLLSTNTYTSSTALNGGSRDSYWWMANADFSTPGSAVEGGCGVKTDAWIGSSSTISNFFYICMENRAGLWNDSILKGLMPGDLIVVRKGNYNETNTGGLRMRVTGTPTRISSPASHSIPVDILAPPSGFSLASGAFVEVLVSAASGGVALATSTASTEQYVDAAMAPLLARIADLESRLGG